MTVKSEDKVRCLLQVLVLFLFLKVQKHSKVGSDLFQYVKIGIKVT